MVDYAGWEMPLLYTGIVEEHLHTRKAASLFDISHMGRIEVRGPDANDLLERVCTRRLSDMHVGQSRYSHVCNEQGGIIDDIIVSRFDDHCLIVCNGANRLIVREWLESHVTGQVRITDITESTLMIALQGPDTMSIINRVAHGELEEIKRYHFSAGELMGMPYTIFRCGYTGEDGVEVILPAMAGQLLGDFLTKGVTENRFKPAGLGARDTLRLEAGMPLYGHELHTEIDSLSAGLAWCVDLEKDFIGAAALRNIAQKGPKVRLVGLRIDGRRIARHHTPVFDNDKKVGEVTSGTFSPTLQQCIALAYVQSAHSSVGQKVTVEISGKRTEAVVVPLPFYKRQTQDAKQ